MAQDEGSALMMDFDLITDGQRYNDMVDSVTTRRCTGCDLCCTALEVFDLPGGKPMGARCDQLDACGACKIYDQRPSSCRVFYCSWRLSEFVHMGIPQKLFPAKCGFVLHWDRMLSPLMTLFKDPARPNAWTKFKRVLEKIARNNNCAVVIGGGKEATHFVTPRGNWFARSDFPQYFDDDEANIGVPRVEFLPRRKDNGPTGFQI